MEDETRKQGDTVTPSLSAYVRAVRTRAHFPGHKGRPLPKDESRLAPDVAAALDGAHLFDVTEVNGLDNLLYPRTSILRTEKWMASLFGARRTLISTCGATAGVLAAILAARICNPHRRTIILTRAAHRSSISACILSGLEPAFVYPRYSRLLGGYLPPCDEEVIPLLDRYSDSAACLFLVNPTYYGLSTDLSRIVEEAHRRSIPVIVDEAHGSHYALSPSLPPSALVMGADVVIHGSHKTLPVLTQASLLHVGQASALPEEALEQALRMVHTSSPSYLVMSSLELGLRAAVSTGWVDSGVRLAHHVLSQLRRLPGVSVNQEWLESGVSCGDIHAHQGQLMPELYRRPGLRWDPGRLSISVHRWSVRGRDIAETLEHEGIYPEMCGPRDVLIVISGSDDESFASNLLRGVRTVLDRFAPSACEVSREPDPPVARVRMSPREAFFSRKTLIPLSRAVGCTAGDIVGVYPPGSAVLIPGEEVTPEAVEYIRRSAQEGLFLAGLYCEESELMMACVESL